MARRNKRSDEPSELQEQIALALYTLSRAGGDDETYGTKKAFRGQEIAQLLGGKWSNYRKLVAHDTPGWIEVYTFYGSWYYALTDAAYACIHDRVGQSGKFFVSPLMIGVHRCV